MNEFEKKVWEVAQKQAIEELMADYWWYMDTKQWDKWADVFTEDVKVAFFGKYAFTDRATFVGTNPDKLAPLSTCHQGHQYKIVFTGEKTATGRFILNDCLTLLESKQRTMLGYGYYLTDFRLCDDGKWRICDHRLGYLRFTPGEEGTEARLDYAVPYETPLV